MVMVKDLTELTLKDLWREVKDVYQYLFFDGISLKVKGADYQCDRKGIQGGAASYPPHELFHQFPKR